jgi:transposase
MATHPDWATKHRIPGTELRLIRGKYYLYEYKTIYDQLTKKPRKISGKILGSITEHDGFKESNKRKVEKMPAGASVSNILVKEFGVIHLIQSRFSFVIDPLKKYFPDHWQQILALAYCRFVHRCAIKQVPFRLESSFFYETWHIGRLTDKSASSVMNFIGQNENLAQDYMRSFVTSGEYLLIDGTHIVSKSSQMSIARKGYNNKYNFDGQVNLLYIFSATQQLPTFYRLLSGNIRDVKALKNTLEMAGITDAVIICDKGFYSKENIQTMTDVGLNFILPLRRDNALIEYSELWQNTFKDVAQVFKQEDRHIWVNRYRHENCIVHLFLDETLRIKEEKDYLNRIVTHPESHSMDQYMAKRNRFGTIAIMTKTDFEDSQLVYQNYKSRMQIEASFDSLKNMLEADSSYMQNEKTLYGWTFINHLCLQWYMKLYAELHDKKLISKISVNDYIQMLTDVKKIKINDKWQLNEFTNYTKKTMAKLDISL